MAPRSEALLGYGGEPAEALANAALNGRSRSVMLLALLDMQLMRHPLPWRRNHDWTHEVVAADGEVVAKFQTAPDADGLIEFAEARAAALEEAGRKVEKLLS